MKKIFYIGLVAAFGFVSCNKDTKSGNTHITGEIKGLKQGTLYIQQVNDSTLVTLDSIVLNGKSTFESSFDLKEPEVLYLGLNRGTSQSVDNLILFFAEPGNLKINSSLDNFSSGATVEGSKNQELFTKYLKAKAVITNKQNVLIKEMLLAQKSKLTVKADSLDKAIQRTTSRVYLNAVNFALKNNKNEVAPYVTLTDVATINNKYLDTIYGNLTPEVAKSKYGVILKDYLELIKKQ
ncbi:DUF4369 domain-containing protein [Flavobacterium sp. xlx-214]|uniref:DUF4369 domain-containing protein n=1 Tax=unclassified Flavobacterium TaxID=196869 RepID=UPI0013D4F817|nr:MULTISPECIES: DUF4369 domain-containing protein [unclassified Flavobacterium]MBA5792285.1 DUF4369 domain-containing protein [Flavobacterium sp. xlx-221]QMI82398.1 DUF4369 domain-containing protein [Flavobacterium sp. xlx-214]